jgi:hypothetical protein
MAVGLGLEDTAETDHGLAHFCYQVIPANRHVREVFALLMVSVHLFLMSDVGKSEARNQRAVLRSSGIVRMATFLLRPT